jgi:hypothetical protein
LICRLLAAVAQPIPRVIQTGPQEIIPWNWIAGNKNLMADYFLNRPVYHNQIFELCFWMSKNLFNWLCNDLQQHNQFWVLKAVSKYHGPFDIFLNCHSSQKSPSIFSRTVVAQ